MTDVLSAFAVRLHEVELKYVQEYMCVTDRCECSNKIEPAVFGIRKSEFEDLSYSEGDVDTFYDDCYLPMVEKGFLEPLPE
jgi:hypothetical protein